jgi:hypothetical protein
MEYVCTVSLWSGESIPRKREVVQRWELFTILSPFLVKVKR